MRFSNKLLQFVSPVPDPLAFAPDALSPQDLDPYAFPLVPIVGKSGGEVARLTILEKHSDCSRVAQHILVWGSSAHVESDPTVPTQPVDPAFQSDLSQETAKCKPTCLAPTASAIKEQSFS